MYLHCPDAVDLIRAGNRPSVSHRGYLCSCALFNGARTKHVEIPLFVKGADAFLARHSHDGSAAAAGAGLIASNSGFSNGSKKWVALGNYVAGISNWNGYMRVSQLVMYLAALRAVPL